MKLLSALFVLMMGPLSHGSGLDEAASPLAGGAGGGPLRGALEEIPVVDRSVFEDLKRRIGGASAAAGGGSAAAGGPVLETPSRALSGFPAIARGHEEVYRRFMGGKLIYRPRDGSNVGRIDLLFKDFVNPETLEGVFNLAGCGETGKYLSIASGYRKGKIVSNKHKVEIWITPKFLVERDLGTTARHLGPIMEQFTAPVGLFWTWGNWDNMNWCDYLVTEDFLELNNGRNLYEKWRRARPTEQLQATDYSWWASDIWWRDAQNSCFVFELK